MVDYFALPARCVNVAEDGDVHLSRARADLLVRGELAAWTEADPTDENRWRLTRASIQRALSAGWTAESIIENLSHRVQQPVSPLMLVAIRAWAEVRALPTSVAVASDIILQIADAAVAEAIAASLLLQPYLRGRLGRQTFLVRHETVEALRGKLEEFGLRVGSDLALTMPHEG